MWVILTFITPESFHSLYKKEKRKKETLLCPKVEAENPLTNF
jgi:hypothetical protein